MRWLALVAVACSGVPAATPVAPVIEGAPEEPSSAEQGPCIDPASCELACKAGNQRDCTRLAFMLDWMLGAAHDEARARSLYEAACAAKEARACELLATDMGETGSPAAEVLEVADRGCELGSAEACLRAERMWRLGLGTTADEAKADAHHGRATSLHGKACAAGGTSGCIAIVVTPRKEVPARQRADALASLASACRKSDAYACNALVAVHLGHYDDEVDGARATALSNRARELLTRACERGDVMACSSVVGCVSWEDLVLLDPEWMSEEGRADACARSIGCGCATASAEEGMIRGCELGLAMSCAQLAELHEERGEPEKVAAFRARTNELMAASCTAGDPWTCADLVQLGEDALKERRDTLFFHKCLSSAEEGVCHQATRTLLERGDFARAIRTAEVLCRVHESCALLDEAKESAKP